MSKIISNNFEMPVTEIRWLTRTTYFGDMFMGEANEEETVLQYRINGEWEDVPEVEDLNKRQ